MMVRMIRVGLPDVTLLGVWEYDVSRTWKVDTVVATV